MSICVISLTAQLLHLIKMTPQQLIDKCSEITAQIPLGKNPLGHTFKKGNSDSKYFITRPERDPNKSGYHVYYEKHDTDSFCVNYTFEYSNALSIWISSRTVEYRDEEFSDYESFIHKYPALDFLKILTDYKDSL
jgi:hypothetical protein